MSLLDTYRRNLENNKKQLLQLQGDKSKEIKKSADIAIKINRAKESIQKSKSQSTLKSKLSEINRLERQQIQIQKKISDIEGKITRKDKQIITEQGKVLKEEGNEQKKRIRESEIKDKERNKQLSTISGNILEQSRIFNDIKEKVDELSKLPEKIVVLFLAMSPTDQQSLQLDEEARAITEMIRKTKHRDSVNFVSIWAVRPFDILQAINEHQPSIIHFSGHGSKDFIAFQDDSGKTKPVSTDAIVQTMMASSEGIRLVFFNTCYSSTQAGAVVQHVEAAIGMNKSIGDEAARVFSAQFYSAIGFGLSLGQAFQQAKALLMLEGINEADTPELFMHKECNSKEMIIVKPLEE